MACTPSNSGKPMLGCCNVPQGAIVNLYAGFLVFAYNQVLKADETAANYGSLDLYSHAEQTFSWTKGPYVGLSKTVVSDLAINGDEISSVTSEDGGFAAAYLDEWSDPNNGTHFTFSLDRPSHAEYTIVSSRKSKDAVPTDDWSRFSRHVVLSNPPQIDTLVSSLINELKAFPFPPAVNGQVLQKAYGFKTLTKEFIHLPQWETFGGFDDQYFLSGTSEPQVFDQFGEFSQHPLAGLTVSYDSPNDFFSFQGISSNAGTIAGQDGAGLLRREELAYIMACKSINFNRTLQCESDVASVLRSSGRNDYQMFCGPFGTTADENAAGRILLPETHESQPHSLIPDLRVPSVLPFDLSPNLAPGDQADPIKKRLRKLFFKDAQFRRYTDANPSCCTFPNPAP